MKWEYEINMDERWANDIDVDEWGCAQVWDNENKIGAEYNYCIDNSTNEMINCCAIYLMYEDEEECWHTDGSDYQHYEIDFSDKDWKGKLIDAMKQFVIEHLEEEKEMSIRVNEVERAKMVLAMEFIARQINDEDVFEGWLMGGVADGDLNYGEWDISKVDDYYLVDEYFKDLMSCFLRRMVGAYNSGGLYCDGIVCKDKEDYKHE